MKKIEAIIRRSKLDEVYNQLREFGIEDITVSYTVAYGNEWRIEIYRGRKYTVNLIGKVKVEAITTDRFADTVAQAIARIAKTGDIGDDKIVITPVVKDIR